LAIYGKPRFLGIVELEDEIAASLPPDGMMIALSHRGEEPAYTMGPLNEAQEREYRSIKVISEHGEGPARGGDPMVSDLEFVRAPSDDDRRRRDTQKIDEDGMLKDAQEMAKGHRLELKIIDVESMMDGKKLFFYFTSVTRVDFRTLVKDLARKFRTRIELRQMGVRDEARIISGIASCGLPCCCSYWLNQFAPIGIKMVKEQNIALNPSKISGICGRLMCCMSFEHKVYKNLWAGLPGPGSKIKTPNGNYVVTAMDIGGEAVRCHKPFGGDISVPIGCFQDFRASVMKGEEWELPESERAAGGGQPCARGKYECPCRRKMESGEKVTGAEPKRFDAMPDARLPTWDIGLAGAKDVSGSGGAQSDRYFERKRMHRSLRRHKSGPGAPPQASEKRERAHCPEHQETSAEPQSAYMPARAAKSRHRRRRPRHGPTGQSAGN
jgi:cell fate regulator YaaT (PSP1 superfamily)